jgi:VWFA-related protein
LPFSPYPFRVLRRSICACLTSGTLLFYGATVFAQSDERIIYTSVVDKDGAPVLDLDAQDFVVREDGVAREVLRVARDTDPLQIALLVDNSAAMRNRVSQLRKAAAAFVGSVRDGVPIALITLAERPTIAAAYTADRGTVQKAVDKLFAYEAGSYLLDGIAETSQALPQRQLWRSAIVVLTGLGPEMSYRQYTEVLRIFRDAGASLHVLQLGTGMGRREREIVIMTGTSETGGRFEEILSPTGFETKAAQLASELSNQYRVVYARPMRTIPPKQVQVSVKRGDLRARGMAAKPPKR